MFKKVKRIILFFIGLIISLALLSCEKEDTKPVVNCKCGEVINQWATADTYGLKYTYVMQVKNDCTKNIRNKSETRYSGTGVPDFWNESIICFEKEW